MTKTDIFFRVEQANLYRLLLDQELFESASFSEEAIEIVTEQIRAFANTQLEILMGLRSPDQSQVVFRSAELPWSEEQIDALTMLADRLLSKGEVAPVKAPAAKLNKVGAKGRKKTKTDVVIEHEPIKAEPVAPTVPVAPNGFINNPERKQFPSQAMWDSLNAQEASRNAGKQAAVTGGGSQLFQTLTR